jgi:hypothetical protein
MDEWESVQINHLEIQKPLVTIRRNAIAFNSYFVKVADLDKASHVSIKVKPKSMQIGFRFHADRKKIDSFALGKDGGGSGRSGNNRIIQAQSFLNNYPWLKAVSTLDQRTRQFEPQWNSIHSFWIISICPPFENRVSDRSEIPNDLHGIYRYKLGDEVVYIGRGAVRSRARSPERDDWLFETIEYSIVPDETEQKKWEAFWLDRFVEQKGKLPKYNRIAGEKSKPVK